MKHFVLALLLTGVLGIAVAADSKTPRLTSVEPDNGKVGDTVTVKGENLDKDVVADLYLTDGKKDVKATITARAPESITFKVPQLEPGRYRLMTASKTTLIEQPVVYEINEP